MRLLFIGLNYAPELVGIGPYTAGIAEALADQGHEVRVICGQPYYPEWKKRRGYKGWSTGRENGVTVSRCPHFVPSDPTGPKRIFHLLSFAMAAILPAISQLRFRPDIVLAVVPTLAALPLAILLARLTGAKLWVHVQDFEAQAAEATGLLRREGLVARLAHSCEGWLLRRADMVSSISPQMCARLFEIGIAPERVYELRNWSNHMAAFMRPASGDYRSEWNLGERGVVLYSGNIANKQGLEMVIEAARLLAGRKDLVFLICGNGPSRPSLERRAEGLENVQFHDLQPAERIGELLSLAALHVLPQIEAAADLVLPSKLANMLASGRPVIVTAEEDTGLASEIAGCGLAVPPGDPQKLADAITKLLESPVAAEAMGREAERRAYERWSFDRIFASAEREFYRLTGAPARG